MHSHSDVILKLSPWLLEGETKRKRCVGRAGEREGQQQIEEMTKRQREKK